MSNTGEGQVNEASLLGLPREVRLHIYSYVFAADLQHTVVKEWRHRFSSKDGFRNNPDLNKDDKLIVPWLNLILSCKTLAIELRAVMQKDTFKNDERNLTYVVDLQATRGGSALGPVTWRQLPCPPSQVKYVEACYDSAYGIQAWGDGGPMGITSALYQTLNHLIHCGPRLDKERLLPKTMHIEELRITTEDRGVPDELKGNPEYRRARETDPVIALYTLGGIVGRINNTGVLRGFVDTIQLSTADKVHNWYPGQRETGGIPAEWDQYGFEWGMEPYLRGDEAEANVQ